jgi:putative transcriptional regulator
MTVKPTKANKMKANERKPQSDALDSVHQMMSGLHEIGLIDKKTMRSFDAKCLQEPAPIEPEQIVQLRKKVHLSQPVFAKYLGVTKSTMAKWESGEKKPSGPSRRLLEVVSRHGIEILEA